MLKGIWLHPMHPPDEILRSARELEKSNLGQVWLGDEGVSWDPFALLAACAIETSRIEMGIAVTNPVVRHPGVVAASAATIAEISGGRFILGWGSGGEESLTPFGLNTQSPIDSVKHAIEFARSVLRCESSSYYQPASHSIPPRFVRQYVGARGPLLNSLASRIADGVFLSGLDDDLLADRVHRARSTREIEVVICQTVKSSGSEEPGTMVGSARSIADRVGELASRFQPTSVCVACVDTTGLSSKIDFSMAILDELH